MDTYSNGTKLVLHAYWLPNRDTQPFQFSAVDESITATLTVTPGGVVSESAGSVQACVTLDAEPTGDVIITLQTVDGLAQGKLFICKSLYIWLHHRVATINTSQNLK